MNAPSKKTDRQRFVLILEASPDSMRRDPVQRLRGALKVLLRGFALKCVSITEQKPAPGASAGPDSQTVG